MTKLEKLFAEVAMMTAAANKERCDAIDRETYGHVITFWTGRQDALLDVEKLITKYMKGGSDES